MRPTQVFTVVPSIPEPLQPLHELAYNLRWSWNQETIELFRWLDSDLWESTGHNPVLMLGRIDQQRLEEVVQHEGFMASLERGRASLNDYLETQGWCERRYPELKDLCIAYFSAEFGITECLAIYSGGLAILAGDALKSASDIGVPVTGVGLLYHEGYFHQYLNADGWQQESYPENDFFNLPIALARGADGAPLTISVDYPSGPVLARIWRAQVGRAPLYLLDTHVDGNRPEDQGITDKLYGGDTEMRIRQEIMLGIGGMRALAAVGLQPVVCHMNEGHSAFLALERIRLLMTEQKLSFAEAGELATAGNAFTTHTPVAAGIDRFPLDMMDRYFGSYFPRLGIGRDEFLGLGRVNPSDKVETFCMAVLALRLSSVSNGVSKLHGQVSRGMWQCVWPGVPRDEVPITQVTNGVHAFSWVSRDMEELYRRYLGPGSLDHPADMDEWEAVERIPAEELWRTHERRRERLVAYARRRLNEQMLQRGAPRSELELAAEVLVPDALTIGFARRFAAYKRPTLILRDLKRLAGILNNRERPVQIIMAGKAHPHDQQGKELIREVMHAGRSEELRHRLVFIEDYDMVTARYLVQGVDVWLNNPRRLEEASGTSGMKAALNGAINLSTLDGWWDEAYRPDIGWAIGKGEMYTDAEQQDQVESNAIYDLLEKDVVPLFYQRGPDGIPRGWTTKMKASMHAIAPYFNSNRMMLEYLEKLYLPVSRRYQRLAAGGMAGARALAAWKQQVSKAWSQLQIEKVEMQGGASVKVGDELPVRATVRLGPLTPSDVSVELYYGQVNVRQEIVNGATAQMALAEHTSPGVYVYSGTIDTRDSGLHGFSVRLLPHNEWLGNPYETGLILLS